MGDIGDVDGDIPSVIGRLHLDGVVEVAGIVRVNRDDVASPQILAPLPVGRGDGVAEAFRLHADRSREFTRQPVLMDHREHVDARRVGGSEHLDDDPLGIHVAVLPAFEARHDLVADAGPLRRGNVQVARETRIVGDDMEEILRLLERSHDGSARPLHHPDDAPLGTSLPAGAAMIAGLSVEARDHAVAVQRGSQMLCGNEKILPSLFFG